ncbi:DedA family protein [Streptosporangium fragile]|uniref:DedA family protein n=1 Tax=Streptosporangium fragile TaxID=46186 RepID=UPI0031E62ACE
MWIIEALDALRGMPYAVVLPVAALLAFAESGLGVGTLFPGETAVVVLGTAAVGTPRFALMLAVVGVSVSAGDHVGYWLGRRYGERMRETSAVRRLGVEHWDRALAALRRHGAAAVFLTRLVPVVRTLVPAAAGASRVPYLRFLPASLLGGLVWAGVYVGIGAFAGASARHLESLVGRIGWIVLAVASAGLAAVLWRRRRQRAAAGTQPAGTTAGADTPSARFTLP